MSTTCPDVDDDYVVKLPSGDARVMSLEELDAAFDAGKLDKDSLVLAPGTVTWTTLGVLAGLDDVAPPSALSPSSLAPMALGGADIEVDVSLEDDDGAPIVPRRRARKVVGVVFGAVALCVAAFAIKGAVHKARATHATEAALAAQPPAPPPPAAVPLPAPIPSPVAEAAPPPPVADAAPAVATSKASAKDKDKKKSKLPGAPKKK